MEYEFPPEGRTGPSPYAVPKPTFGEKLKEEWNDFENRWGFAIGPLLVFFGVCFALAVSSTFGRH